MNKPTPIDEEYVFSKGVIVSSTDLKGTITYANRKFCEIAGYSKTELTGENHNIVRHPDMPKSAFAGLWEQIESGKEWQGIVKNLRKDGKHYWVHTHISPIEIDGERIGYVAARRPVERSDIEESIAKYKQLSENEN